MRSAGQLAAVLEVSGWPKPGNVHRTRDHPDACYEHFLAGSIALGSAVGAAALRGMMAGEKRIDVSEIDVGKLVKKAVSDVAKSHNGGNTHLGVCLLFIPLASAAAKTYVEEGKIQPDLLRRNVKEIMESTTPEDAVEVYDAIRMVSSPRELGSVGEIQEPDLYDERAVEKILTEGISLFDVMKASSSWDTVARELSTGMEVSFELGYKELMDTFRRTGDINIATVHTFLRILSEHPDTFIARKVGLKRISNIEEAVEIGIKETSWISDAAAHVLELGGSTTEEGQISLWELDDKLQGLGKDFSPGTTADLTAASLMIALLCGLRF